MAKVYVFEAQFKNSAKLVKDLYDTEIAIKNIVKEINIIKKTSFSFDKLVQEQNALKASLAGSQAEMQKLSEALKAINRSIAEAKKSGDTGAFAKLTKEQQDLTAKLFQTKEKIVDATVAIRNLDAEIAKSGTAKEKFVGLIAEQTNLKAKLTETRAAIREQDLAFKATKYPIDSIKGMSQQYTILTNKIREMSAAQRQSNSGQAIINQAAKLKDVINKQSQAFGDTSRNIGNYANSLKQGLASPLQFLSLAGIGAGITQLGIAAVKSSVNIEKLYFQIKNLTQSTDADLSLYKEKIRGISDDLGVGQEALLSGLFRITSGGLNGAKALDLLQLSAKASAIGLGDVNVIAGTLTGVINAYGQNNLTAAKAAEVLFQTVKLGSGEVSQLAGPFSNVTTLAAKLGISIETVGGSIASITNKGVQAAESITQLESIMIALQKPTAEGEKVLNELNLSYEELRKMAANNLPRALQFLNEQLGGNEEKITAILGRKEALVGFFSLAGQNAESFADLVNKATQASGQLEAAFKVFEETNAQKIEKAWVGVKNVFIDIGGAIVNATSKLGDFLLSSTRFGAAIKKQAEKQKSITVAEALASEQRTSFNAGYDLTQSTGVLAPGAKEEGTRDALIQQKLANDAAKKLEEDALKSKNAAQLAAAEEKKKKELDAFRKRRKFEEDLAKQETEAKIALIQDEFARLAATTRFELDKLEQTKRDILESANEAGAEIDIEGVNKHIENLRKEIENKYVKELSALKEKLDVIKIPTVKGVEAFADAFDIPDSFVKAAKENKITFEELLTGMFVMSDEEKAKLAEDMQKDENDLSILMTKQLERLTKNTKDIQEKNKKKEDNKINVLDIFLGRDKKPKTQEEQDAAIEQRAKDTKEALEKAAQELKQIGIDALGDIALGSIDQKQKEIENETQMRLDSLQYEYDKKREFAIGNAELIAKLDKEQAEKAAVIQKEQAKKQAKLNIQKVIIEGAVAIAKTFAYYGFTPAALIAAALQAAMTIKQVAVIKAQSFAKGGAPKRIRKVDGLVVGPGTETSDSIPAFLSKDEYVLNAKMKRAIGMQFLEELRAWTLGFGPKPKKAVNLLTAGSYSSSQPFAQPRYRYASGGAVGGSSAFIPNVNLQPINNGSQNITISDESMINFTNHFALVAGQVIRQQIGIGLMDANKRIEREQVNELRRKQ